ncbi:hypothetical protein SAMN05444141_101556 [Pseudovibrio denitrificans]|uniref:Uncharacterized protein n=1 Tax=Pseudovibrio denitrificans TaxID=258256 RepID=A0A1I6Y0C3_9HYPH|nr:hypothetical protein [Pseudovibrio denitrificans]SFT43876.1 hypothetical protein SAMN05444141_101556 [Pseudovibrio denitrificans]
MQRIYSLAMGLCALCFALLSFTSAVWAATEDSYTIDLAPLADAIMPTLIALLGALVSAVLAWAGRLLHRYVGVSLDERHRKTLEDIVVSKLRQMLTDAYEGNRASMRIHSRSQLVAEVADYAARKAPDAIRHFKLQPAELAEFVSGRVGPKTLQKIQHGTRTTGQGST